MSGTFEDIDVPPTLVSFAVTTANADNIISPEFKQAGSKIMYIAPKYDENYLPDFADVKRVFDIVEQEIARKNALSVWTLSTGGIAEGVFKMCLGNRIGANLQTGDLSLFTPCCGAFIIEAKEEFAGAQIIGKTNADYVIKCNDVQICIAEHEALWESVLEPIFPSKTPPEPAPQIISHSENGALGAPAHKTQKPRVLIPVFPGTHGEYDIQRAFEREGADAEFFVMKNLSASAIGESFAEFARLAQASNIIAIPGGISAGGEPDGAGKLIAVFLQNAQTADAVQELLRRGGLILGIGDGLNALLRAGLLSSPSESVSLTTNKIGRHQSQMVYTRISSVKSPWLSLCRVGEVYAAPFSSGEGRIIISDEAVQRLIQNGQIAAQYADLGGNPSMETAFNPAGSMYAVEGIMSANGQILGKMAHSERVIADCAINFPGEKNLPLFKAGVEYFR
jgi:phosphoribosylformylglycinamidine synthase